MRCNNIGTWRYVWPGKQWAYACDEHIRQVVGVAGALGFFVNQERVTDSEPHQCDQQIKEETPDGDTGVPEGSEEDTSERSEQAPE